MHLFMSSPSTDSTLSTPSPSEDLEFVHFSVPPALQDLWPISTLAMADQLFSEHYGRLSAPAQDWTPSSAVRDCCSRSEPHLPMPASTPTPMPRGGGGGEGEGELPETVYSQYHQVSSFNLPLIYDSTLTTPVSLHPESPNPQGKVLNDGQWGRSEHPSLQYPMRSNDGIYMATSSMSMKSKNDSITMSVSDPDSMLAISPFIFDSPSTPCPPTPYWGSFGVSAPTTAPTAPTSASTPNTANPSVTVNAPPGGTNQAPILIAPSPHRRSRQSISDEGHIQKQRQPGQQIQMSIQIQQQAGIKRECPSPTSKTKRRRRSVQPVEQQKPLSRDDLSEEDKILLHLRDIKEDEKWDWKELTERFNRETGGKHNLAALQMRHTRLVERMRVWTDAEVRALNRAKIQYDNQKWKLIAESMLDYGCETKWSPHACQLKWQELHPGEGAFDEYGAGSWNDNNTTVSTPQRQNSGMSYSHDELEGNGGGGNTPIIIDQANLVSMRQRTGSKGSNRGSRGGYEQRQDWTVRPQ